MSREAEGRNVREEVGERKWGRGREGERDTGRKAR